MTYKRVDSNHGEIVKQLRKLGFSVQSTATIGKGFPDLAIGYGGLCVLAEIKTATGKLTGDQERFYTTWTGGKYLLRNEDDCMHLMQTMCNWARWINEGIERDILKGDSKCL